MPAQHALCCPHCHHPLEQPLRQESVFCSNCETHYPYREQVLDFIPDEDFYWGEIGRDEMVQLNQNAERDGWFSAIYQRFEDDPSKIAYITDPARLGWLFHSFDEQANEACLSVGSGWGSLEFPLSRFYKTVYSVDGVYERLRFQAIRATEEDVDNLVILRSSLLRLPLADNSVDLVVINGVLEWVGLSDLEREPEALQVEFLQEINRVLKPHGRVYIGIENRLSALYFMGAADHSGLPFTSLMPRRLTNAIYGIKSLRKSSGNRSSIHVFSGKESAYRTYTYSAWGYESLLRRSGFSHTSIYWAWPSYSYPRMSGPFDSESIRYMVERIRYHVDSPWLHLASESLFRLPKQLIGLMSKLFAPHFLIVASPQPNETTLQEEILKKHPTSRSFVRLCMGVNAEVKSTFLLLDRDSRVSKAIRVVEHTLEHANVQESLHGFTYQESDGLQGRSIRPNQPVHVRAAATWLADFHRKSARGYWPTGKLLDELHSLVQTAGTLEKKPETFRLLQAYAARYEQFVRTMSIPVTAEHGDYTIPNIMIDDAGEMNVIDWEFSREQGNPLMDVGALCFSLLRNTSSPGSFSAQIQPHTPLHIFVQAYGSFQEHGFSQGSGQEWPVPFLLSPTYYLLRLIHRIHSQSSEKPITHLMLLQWLPLLHPMLEFSLAREEIEQPEAVLVT